MDNTTALQPAWDFLLENLGAGFIGSPAFLLTAVVLGVYVPGIVFSVVDVFVTRRMTLADNWAVYWRAMKWYSAAYVVGMALLLNVTLPFSLVVPAAAPALSEFLLDLLLYFLVGDFASYVWHRLEHAQGLYARKVHYFHHMDKPPLSIWTAMVVHPVEGITVFFFFHIYGIFAAIHPLTFAIAAFLLTAVTMITHCGYRLPVYDWFFATATGHNLHHTRREPVNVSVVLTLCDRLFGTFRKVA
ncbi:MAG TPA: sterol desaturase family protein [Solimonas sp.]|nr:sterol desaturase family protein [Solimonas sp.]